MRKRTGAPDALRSLDFRVASGRDKADQLESYQLGAVDLSGHHISGAVTESTVTRAQTDCDHPAPIQRKLALTMAGPKSQQAP